ncbi:Hpt domain-containing protein [Pseudomonas cichorii]|uniref:Hpt domain-containing protein n=1 Tax=Pseudomonas lijiangensis TaxID=2995658 RepID=A0ABX8HN35_9PSED|nr:MULTISPECIES: Hpt domain-containing protein [Pseudomonas syringae group]MBX8491490.1 Hpt domain-containing protein [Pseudomonas cichorii]MBX8499657.1 Hpt domain-containing protein [Pseudomonas lijiangensis]MBX8505223.1 Hpt domain-containing protein [Pseudomonas lijiangensis]MBX8508310.1 Hpt domain-containing protein [Pseudomonas cichorii]MBX8519710.1 Hpt domain-containing protein [Pseudomonas cichorii]
MSIHLDYSVLSVLQEVMEDEYPTLLDVFLKDSEQRVTQLRRAIDTELLDMQELSLTAHSFKGSSSNMGAMVLSDLCRQLEERARQQQRAGLEELIGLIDSEYLTIRRLFDAERQLFIGQT